MTQQIEGHTLTPLQRQVLDLYLAGNDQTQTAILAKTTRNTVRGILARLRQIGYHVPDRRGCQNGGRKMTEDELDSKDYGDTLRMQAARAEFMWLRAAREERKRRSEGDRHA